MRNNVQPRIYVACLASYNNGILHGRWIDASDDVSEMMGQINSMLRNSPFPNVRALCPDCEGRGCEECDGIGTVPTAEEWAIHDSEGLGDVSEHESLTEIARRVEAYEQAEIWNVPVEGILDAMEAFDMEAEDVMNDRFYGTFDTWEAMAEDLWEQAGYLDALPERVALYIDFERVGRDLMYEGGLHTVHTDEGIMFFDAS